METGSNKENNVFKDAIGVKGLGFKHHGNHPCSNLTVYRRKCQWFFTPFPVSLEFIELVPR